jgi:hypothetical protein
VDDNVIVEADLRMFTQDVRQARYLDTHRTLPLAILATPKRRQAAASFGAFGVISRIR